MANANVMFGSKSGGWPAYDSDFASETVAGGAVTDATIPAGAYVRVAAIDGDVYAAFGPGADASEDPQVFLATGQSIEVRMRDAGIVSIENAA